MATVTNEQLTSNVATLTTSAAHGFAVYDSVVVQDVGAPFDGIWVVTAVTTTTFSYAVTNADIASQAANGQVALATDLDLLMARLILMEEEVVPGSNAVEVAFYEQETYPFWTNRIEHFTQVQDSQFLRIVTYTIVMRLVLASFEEDYQKLSEMNIAKRVPPILDFFARRIFLQCAAAPAGLRNLDPRGTWINDGKTLYGQLNTPINANQFGIELSLEVPFEYEVVQVYP